MGWLYRVVADGLLSLLHDVQYLVTVDFHVLIYIYGITPVVRSLAAFMVLPSLSLVKDRPTLGGSAEWDDPVWS